MNKEKTAIIILNYNGLPFILDCLDSLHQSSIINHQSSIILVDNASADKSVELIKKKFPKIKIIQNRVNLGFAGGNNVAIKYALKNNFDNIMLLNPDTIVEKNFLKPLLQLISNKKIGIVSPVLKGKEGSKIIFALGAKFNPILGRTKHVHLKRSPLSAVEQEMVSGCAMMVKREVFEKIGLFDERFFLYFEDSDFCLRASKAGFKIYVEPKSVIIHKCSSSLGGLSLKKIKYVLWSNFLFNLKWVKPYFWPFAFSYLIVLAIKMIIDWLALNKRK